MRALLWIFVFMSAYKVVYSIPKSVEVVLTPTEESNIKLFNRRKGMYEAIDKYGAKGIEQSVEIFSGAMAVVDVIPSVVYLLIGIISVNTRMFQVLGVLHCFNLMSRASILHNLHKLRVSSITLGNRVLEFFSIVFYVYNLVIASTIILGG